jgi:hypothetical protein
MHNGLFICIPNDYFIFHKILKWPRNHVLAILEIKGNNMDWMQVLFLFFANSALILWFRAESRADWRKSDSELKEFRELWMAELRDMDDRWINTNKEFNEKWNKFNEKWLQESKEFHQKLCDIEAKRK